MGCRGSTDSLFGYFICPPSELDDGLNSYVFMLKILLIKEKKVALAPIYLGSLCARLAECVANLT